MWQDLKDAISLVFTSNNNNEITGQDAREALNTLIIPSLGALQYKGLALPYVDAQNTGTDPGTPGGAAFYLTSAVGDYPNFDGSTITGELVAFVFDHNTGTWLKDIILTVEQAQGEVTQAYVDEGDALLNARINALGVSDATNKILSFSAGYQGGLTYQPFAKWQFGETSFEASATIALAAADATFSRIDLLVLNDNGTITKITGTPAENPVEPDYNINTQLKAAFILIEAGALAPAGVALVTIYDNNLGWAGGEWSTQIITGDETRWIVGDATDPQSGATAIKGNEVLQYDNLRLRPENVVPIEEFTELSFYIKNLESAPTQNPLYLHAVGESSSVRGRTTRTEVLPNMFSYGYDPANIIDWQFITIPIPALSLNNVEYLSLIFDAPGAFSFLIDSIKYNDGSAPTGAEFATVGWVVRYAEAKLPAAPGTEKTLVIKADGTKAWEGEKYTLAEKDKLAALKEYYLGKYTTLAALQVAHPTAIAGNEAEVDAGVGNTALRYIWDSDDNNWVQQLGESNLETAASVKTKLLANADTFTVTQAEKDKIAEINKAPIAVSVSRALASTDSGRKLLITAAVTLTWPAGGIVGFACNFDIDATGQLTIADSAGTPGAELDAPDGTILEAGSMGHAYKRPDNNKLRLKGTFIV